MCKPPEYSSNKDYLCFLICYRFLLSPSPAYLSLSLSISHSQKAPKWHHPKLCRSEETLLFLYRPCIGRVAIDVLFVFLVEGTQKTLPSPPDVGGSFKQRRPLTWDSMNNNGSYTYNLHMNEHTRRERGWHLYAVWKTGPGRLPCGWCAPGQRRAEEEGLE